MGSVHPVLALERFGGVARRQDLMPLTTGLDLRAAVLSGEIVRDARGRYSLASADEARRTAHAVTGVLSHTSAALHWGWPVKAVPDRPHVTVRRKRRLSAGQRQLVVPHWRDLTPDEVVDGVTSCARTLVDCLTDLPFDEALSIADSALRARAISAKELIALAASARGGGTRQARRVAALADRRPANPFESVLRAIAADVAGLEVTPQLTIETPRLIASPDLVDPRRRIVLEADSHTWHSSRKALRRDCRRYNALVLDRWTVLRFTWEQVMFEPDDVRSCLEDVVILTDGQARRAKRRQQAA
jgi:very-short-patch-repair endonuclease